MKASLDSIIPQQGLEPADAGIDVGGCEPPVIFNPAPEPDPLPPDIWVDPGPDIIVNPGPEGPEGPDSPEPPEVVVNPFTQGPESGPEGGPIVNPAPERPWTEILQGGIHLGDDSPWKKLG